LRINLFITEAVEVVKEEREEVKIRKIRKKERKKERKKRGKKRKSGMNMSVFVLSLHCRSQQRVCSFSSSSE